MSDYLDTCHRIRGVLKSFKAMDYPDKLGKSFFLQLREEEYESFVSDVEDIFIHGYSDVTLEQVIETQKRLIELQRHKIEALSKTGAFKELEDE